MGLEVRRFDLDSTEIPLSRQAAASMDLLLVEVRRLVGRVQADIFIAGHLGGPMWEAGGRGAGVSVPACALVCMG
eukprot:scaffold35313_cov157-Isochrysis_galbana.AAC.1